MTCWDIWFCDTCISKVRLGEGGGGATDSRVKCGQWTIYHYDVMGGNKYMETSCFCAFMLLNYMKVYVSMYFVQLMLTLMQG